MLEARGHEGDRQGTNREGIEALRLDLMHHSTNIRPGIMHLNINIGP